MFDELTLGCDECAGLLRMRPHWHEVKIIGRSIIDGGKAPTR
jgi:hypothetical protein